MSKNIAEKARKLVIVRKRVKLDKLPSYKTQIFVVGATISFLIGGTDLLLPFIVIWFSYFVFESYAWEFGLDMLGVELITLGCVLVGMKFEPAFSFLYAYLIVGTMSSIAKFVDPDSDDISNPFGSYAFGYGIAALSAAYFKGAFTFPELLFLAALIGNIGRVVFDLLVYRSVTDVIAYTGNVIFNGFLALFFSFLAMVT